MGNLISFMKEVADELQERGHYGTAHIYRSSMNSLIGFYGGRHLPFQKVTPGFLKKFEIHLRENDCSWNTVSTYMRMVRAVYNRAVVLQLAPYVPHHFQDVYTGNKADRKRALEADDMRTLADALPERLAEGNKDLERTRDFFMLMFFLRGMPFVDLVYLKKRDLVGNEISYRRRKTGRPLTVTLVEEAMRLVKKYMNTDPSSPYLFSFITSGEGTEAAYKEYQLALRDFNYRLVLLKQVLGIDAGLSSYTARHTWATLAYHCEVHPGIISEAMGHSSITVTETYLKPFRNKKIDEANLTVISSLRQPRKSSKHLKFSAVTL